MEVRSGVKCDTCSWDKDCENLDEVLTWIDVDCPECGKQKILTEEDRREIEFSKAVASFANTLEEVMDIPDDAEKCVMSMDSHFLEKLANGENPLDLITVKKVEEDEN